MPLSQTTPDIFRLTQQSAYDTGLVLRCAQSLITLDDHNELFNVVKTALDGFGISGLLKIQFAEQSRVIKIGSGGSRTRLSAVFNCVPNGKVTVIDDIVIINTRSLHLFAQANQTQRIGDQHQDSLLALCETIQKYIDNQEDYLTRFNAVHDKHLESAEHLKTALQCLTYLNKHLIEQGRAASESLTCQLATMLPTLGLEFDQEEKILGLIESSTTKMKGLIEAQSTQNKDLEMILVEAINALVTEVQHVTTSRVEPPSEPVELFD